MQQQFPTKAKRARWKYTIVKCYLKVYWDTFNTYAVNSRTYTLKYLALINL